MICLKINYIKYGKRMKARLIIKISVWHLGISARQMLFFNQAKAKIRLDISLLLHNC